MLNYGNFVSRALLSRSTAEAEAAILSDGGLAADPPPSLSDSELKVSDMYYFELFHLNPIRANITFLPLPNPDKLEGEDDDDESVIERVLGFVGALASIERAPLELNGLMLEYPFTTQRDLTSRITQHYTMAALKQAYLLVGSADFLGNPVSLVSNLGTGVRDFFYEPAQGIVKSPQDFGKGLAKGTASLVKKSTYALFDTASKLTGTVAKVGATLTMDDDYKRERAARSAVQAKHAGEGIMYGFRDFGIGLYKGVTGVVLEPIKGAQKEGALGLLKGVGRGMAGVVLKPVVGAVDIVTRTTEGIKNTTRYFDDKRKAPIRPPRFIGGDKLISTFNLDKSIGQQILRTVDVPQIRRDAFIAHKFLKDKSGKNDDVVVLTRLRIVLVTSQVIKTSSGFHVDWHELYKSMDNSGSLSHTLLTIFTDIQDSQIVDSFVAISRRPRAESSKKRSLRKIPFHDPQDAQEVLQLLRATLGGNVTGAATQVVPLHGASRQREQDASSSSANSEVRIGMPSNSRDGPIADSSAAAGDVDVEIGLDPPMSVQDTKSERASRAPKRKGKRGEKSPLLGGAEAESEDGDSCCSCCSVC